MLPACSFHLPAAAAAAAASICGLLITASTSPYSTASSAPMKKSRSVSCARSSTPQYPRMSQHTIGTDASTQHCNMLCHSLLCCFLPA